MKKYLLILVVTLFSTKLSAQDFSLNVNAIPIIDGAINAGAAYAINDRYTIDLSGAVRPWARGEDNVNKYWGAKPELRYWTCQKFNGSFFGAFMTGSQYNVGGKDMPFGLFPDVKKYRYEGWSVGGGISYGYHFMLNDHWNLEASIGAGYNYYEYTQYECPVLCARVLKNGKYHYWGINTLSLSLVYLF
ncbi:MAG: DUF3575 domain-containing protein [Rikenellaceae bacterium]